MTAVEFAKAHGARRIVIHHDYEGIARWPRGDWKTGRTGTKAYAEAMREAGAFLKIEFEKVLAHSGNPWNDEADRLAKTVIYNLNPADNELFATMIGNFQDGTVPGRTGLNPRPSPAAGA